MARTYIGNIAGGTATVTVQIQGRQTFRHFIHTGTSAAVGQIELSTSPTSQIGTAQPDTSVIARLNVTATAGPSTFADVPINLPVIAFQNVYVHCTGAGNVGVFILSS